MIMIHAECSEPWSFESYEIYIIYISADDKQLDKIFSGISGAMVVFSHTTDIETLVKNPPLILNNMYFAEIFSDGKLVEVTRERDRLQAQYKLDLFNFEEEFFNKVTDE